MSTFLLPQITRDMPGQSVTSSVGFFYDEMLLNTDVIRVPESSIYRTADMGSLATHPATLNYCPYRPGMRASSPTSDHTRRPLRDYRRVVALYDARLFDSR